MMLLNKNPDMITVMEDDLKAKIQVAIDCNPDLRMAVYGVFSIDDLETKMESDLGGNVGVGVQFRGAQKAVADPTARHDGTFNAARGQAGRNVQFTFTVILAVPCTELCDERHSATKLLSALMLSILGKPLDGDAAQRTWDFVNQQPEPGASTATMMYYAQVWQLAMPVIGNAA